MRATRWGAAIVFIGVEQLHCVPRELLYDRNYAVSTLQAQLREQADLSGEEVLERRHDAWSRLVASAVARIDDGALGKVVLARQVDVSANRPFVTSDVLSRLLALYPTCMIFRVDGFLGAQFRCKEKLLRFGDIQLDDLRESLSAHANVQRFGTQA